MAGVNKVLIIGRMGKDPEVKQAGSTTVANFSLATDESYTKDGQKIEKTEWHNCVAWGRLAEIVRDYTSKGSQIYVEGKLQTRQWDDKNGNKRYTTEIVAQSIQLLGSKNVSHETARTAQEIEAGDTSTEIPF